ncbi:unnamed protein product [Mesocestoides corti]|uniref:Secreted protein n=1 Tax=Mesocestoides corti TaxID=53468 RepID=A0A0R3U2Y6_MESCO|nr:unnamed protein product [Mesocestoides corti]
MKPQHRFVSKRWVTGVSSCLFSDVVTSQTPVSPHLRARLSKSAAYTWRRSLPVVLPMTASAPGLNAAF